MPAAEYASWPAQRRAALPGKAQDVPATTAAAATTAAGATAASTAAVSHERLY